MPRQVKYIEACNNLLFIKNCWAVLTEAAEEKSDLSVFA